ncbi:MAG: DUF547 domain-containing protein [Crocinitomicaceae bacterium]|nr:DUF547 domain-containing protein [Crocinitomicaceae bacterium]
MKTTILLGVLVLFVACSEAKDDNTASSDVDIINTSEMSIDSVLPNNLEVEINDSLSSVLSSDTTIDEIESNVLSESELQNIPVVDFHQYQAFSKFLSAHVSLNGNVNYKKIKSDIGELNTIIEEFKSNTPQDNWSRNEKLSYWINAYNLFTLKLVTDNYPINSITSITAKPWDKKFIQLQGKTLSLNDIEHSIIRATYNEPRIHFALNCTSESCPQLLNVAFTPNQLSAQLTRQTKLFLDDPSRNDFSNPNSIKISQLFDWYRSDFERGGSLIDFINKYRTEKLGAPNIDYLEYSWDLND